VNYEIKTLVGLEGSGPKIEACFEEKSKFFSYEIRFKKPQKIIHSDAKIRFFSLRTKWI